MSKRSRKIGGRQQKWALEVSFQKTSSFQVEREVLHEVVTAFTEAGKLVIHLGNRQVLAAR